jgi:putative oligomerization/nucleic acid binding protein
VADLPVVSHAGGGETESSQASESAGADPSVGVDGAEIMATIERLARLKEKGILTEEEFAAKKAQLLARL